MNCNHKNFSKVKESEAYDNKIHENVIDNNVRDKTLSRQLKREDCD